MTSLTRKMNIAGWMILVWTSMRILLFQLIHSAIWFLYLFWFVYLAIALWMIFETYKIEDE